MFKPHNKFDYKDDWFLKLHESKLFPEKAMLHDFGCEVGGLNNDIVAIAYLVFQDGYFNGLEQILFARYEHAFKHLEFLSSLLAREYLSSRTDQDRENLNNLIIFILTYVIHKWFIVGKIELAFPFSPRLLHPLKITKTIGIKHLFDSEKTRFLVENYIKNLNIDLTHCKALANKICLFGYNANMLKYLDPRPNLNYKAVMGILNYYVEKRDITKISKVLAIYFPEQSIIKAFKDS